jgi:hypothetical protein
VDGAPVSRSMLANPLGRHACWSVGRCAIAVTIASTLNSKVLTGYVESRTELPTLTRSDKRLGQETGGSIVSRATAVRRPTTPSS